MKERLLTAEEINEIYKIYRVPHHIKMHMIVVADFAADLCDKFMKKGYEIDKNLVVTAALLHDTVRTIGLGHEKAMAEILRKMGHKLLANLVAKHDFFEVKNLKTWEEKILYYADKRVDYTKIVSLKKRLSRGKKRNSKPEDDASLVNETENKVFALEREIMDVLS